MGRKLRKLVPVALIQLGTYIIPDVKHSLIERSERRETKYIRNEFLILHIEE